LNLLENFEFNEKSSMNYLMQMALEKVVFLPFAYVMDRWRWEVFGGLEKDSWNERWWELREEYQGVVSPVSRSSSDFDPGAKYHITTDYPYISYFVAHVLQFQFHKRLCEKAGQYDPEAGLPLHQCDIYQSKAAGELFGSMLSRGASTHWKDTLESFMGTNEMDPSAMLEFFDPLSEFLDTSIKEFGDSAGWQQKIIFADELTTEIPANCTDGQVFDNVTDTCNKTTTQNTDETVPIIVGAVLGGLIIIVLIAYVIGRRRVGKQEEEEIVEKIDNGGHDEKGVVVVLETD